MIDPVTSAKRSYYLAGVEQAAGDLVGAARAAKRAGLGKAELVAAASRGLGVDPARLGLIGRAAIDRVFRDL